jgi:hypothetical protein
MSLRFLAAVVLAVVLATSAEAQAVYRKDVPAGEATPTDGTFSIRFPVPFTDAEMKAGDPPAPPVVIHMLTGANSDNVRFSASETAMLGLEPRPMEDFMTATGRRPGAVVSDPQHDTKDGVETLSFELEDSSGGYFFRMIRHNNIQYMQVIQFPKTERAQAAAVRDDFFGSFKLTKP